MRPAALKAMLDVATTRARSFVSISAVGIVSVITVAGAVLRFLHIFRKSFWLDEGVSVAIARLDWLNLLHILWRREANMALYYGLLRIWLHFGHSEAYVRGLSAVFSVGAIPVVYLLGRKLFNEKVGLIAASLFAVHAWQVRYAQEARSYSLYVLLTALSSLFLVKVLEQPTRRNGAAYTAASTLAIYSHFFAVLLIVVQCAAVYWAGPDGAVRKQFWRSVKIILVLFIPLAVFIASRGAGPIAWISRPNWSALHEFALFLTGNAGDLLLVIYLLCCTLAIVGWRRKQGGSAGTPWQGRWAISFLLCWLSAPVLITLAFSLARPVFLPRYLLMCATPLVLLAAAGLAQIRPAPLMFAAVALMIALSAKSTAAYYQADFDLQREDWRSATEYLLSHSDPGDAVIFHSAQARMPFEYYAESNPGRQNLMVAFPAHGNGRELNYRDFLANAKNANIAEIATRNERVWLVLAHNHLPTGSADTTTASLQESLSTSDLLLDRQQFAGGIALELYGRR
jgi:mannosyltransferase